MTNIRSTRKTKLIRFLEVFVSLTVLSAVINIVLGEDPDFALLNGLIIGFFAALLFVLWLDERHWS